MGAEAFIIEIVEGAAQAVVEDGVSVNRQSVVAVDAEASSVEGIVLQMQIVLELVVGNDLACSLALVGQHAP